MKTLNFVFIVCPILAAGECFLVRITTLRSLIVLMTSVLLMAASLLLIPVVPFQFSPKMVFGINIHGLAQAADFLLLFVILYFGIKHRNLWIIEAFILNCFSRPCYSAQQYWLPRSE